MTGRIRRLFDVYICVDWSASSTPKTGKDSIWIGCLDADGVFTAQNPATRQSARSALTSLIEHHRCAGRKLLIGFDFALGYPSGTAKALQLDLQNQAPWHAMHAYLAEQYDDGPKNTNSRFAHAAQMNALISGTPTPFGARETTDWTDPIVNQSRFDLPQSLAEHRKTEMWVKSQFKANPKSVWQLLGIGSVGSQALLGIPTVHALRQHFPR